MTKPLGQLSQSEKTEKPEKRETYWTPCKGCYPTHFRDSMSSQSGQV